MQEHSLSASFERSSGPPEVGAKPALKRPASDADKLLPHVKTARFEKIHNASSMKKATVYEQPKKEKDKSDNSQAENRRNSSGDVRTVC
jgi:hypothetical protein